MIRFLFFAILIGCVGFELFLTLKRTHTVLSQDKELAEAAQYTIIDLTPPLERL